MQRNILLALVAVLCSSFWQPHLYSTRGNTDYDPNGIRKYYMGRQIAQVMSHYGIEWLERPEREQEERVTKLLKNMDLKPGEVIADIGAGSGYHVVRMAPLVGTSGKVYAVDIQPEMLAYVKKQAKDAGLSQVVTVLGTEKEVRLPKGSIDKMLLVDVYHELAFPYEMAISMWEALKPGGKLYLVEYRAEDASVPIKPIHKMSEEQTVKEWQAAGFRLLKNMTNLPWQHCLCFEKPR
jgi:ubiquinone/menaquinone biosynthesis C-methylase UbiE